MPTSNVILSFLRDVLRGCFPFITYNSLGKNNSRNTSVKSNHRYLKSQLRKSRGLEYLEIRRDNKKQDSPSKKNIDDSYKQVKVIYDQEDYYNEFNQEDYEQLIKVRMIRKKRKPKAHRSTISNYMVPWSSNKMVRWH